MAAPRLPIVLLWVCVLLLASASSAAADPAEPPPEESNRVRATEILADLDRREPDPGWLSLELARMRLSGKYGLIYSRRLEAVELRLRGPALGRSTNVGISVEVRF